MITVGLDKIQKKYLFDIQISIELITSQLFQFHEKLGQGYCSQQNDIEIISIVDCYSVATESPIEPQCHSILISSTNTCFRSFGVVYKATHRATGGTLAIKVLNIPKNSEKNKDQESFEGLKKELNILQKCNNDSIVRYYGYPEH
jgi:hypothetical protein